MAIHKLKTVQPFFDQVKEGKKKFELRKNDRDFKVNDLLILEEFDPDDGDEPGNGYSGKAFVVKVDYILENYAGVESGYCIMGVTKTRL